MSWAFEQCRITRLYRNFSYVKYTKFSSISHKSRGNWLCSPSPMGCCCGNSISANRNCAPCSIRRAALRSRSPFFHNLSHGRSISSSAIRIHTAHTWNCRSPWATGCPCTPPRKGNPPGLARRQSNRHIVFGEVPFRLLILKSCFLCISFEER